MSFMTSPINPPAPLSGNDLHSRHQFTNEQTKRILIHNARFLFTCDAADHILMQTNQSLVIANDEIIDSGPAANFEPRDFAYVYDAGKRGGTVITPGFITTEMTESLTETQKEAILRNIPLGIFGTPEDVATLVAFLASPESHYITGQVIGVNGGMYM